MSDDEYSYRYEARDPEYKFKKNYSLPREYETFLQLEKNVIEKNASINSEPMEKVARKILRGLPLNHEELQAWAHYNFLVLPDEEQEILRQFIWRQSRVNSILSVSVPVIGFGSYAINRYIYKMSTPKNCLVQLGIVYLQWRAFNYGINKDRSKELTRMYELYGAEVNQPKYRGLKLFGGKHVNDVKEKQYTSSNVDEFRKLVDS